MKKLIKTLGIVGMAGVAGLSLASCDNNKNDEKVKVSIGSYLGYGNTLSALEGYLDSIKDDLNFEYTLTQISQTDANSNLSKFQNDLETGTDLIITMMDNDAQNTKAILEACEEYGAYLAGWQTDFNNTRASDVADEVLNSDHFLGAATDGEMDGKVLGQYLWDAVSASENRVIALARTPYYAYPSGHVASVEIARLAEEWNKANPDDQFTIVDSSEGTNDLGGVADADADLALNMGFGGNLAETQLDKWVDEGVEAIVAVNSLAQRIYSTLVSENQDKNIDLYTVGWDDALYGSDVFGSNGTIKSLGQSVVETIIYPLIMGINAVRGYQFSDAPTTGLDKFVEGKRIMLTSDEDMEAGHKNCMIYAGVDKYGDPSRALIQGEDLVNYLGNAEGASFAKLKDLINSWDKDYVLYRK